ncbi:sugar transferase [Halorussus caseinilyticus]|uniref:Sugar transferase n=1 Tax=Halorussus caseinilyticus TaxID=3034025 RepID=A0ABD5WT34_9EURY|nr:sugar transferase [Halorussus sp. DT72]
MVSGHRYRVVSVVGTALLAVGAVVAANHPTAQSLTTAVPVFRRLPAVVLTGDALVLAVVTTALIVVGSLVPLYKPRPRRILDTLLLTQKRVVVAGLAMATVGYFDYTYPLPRSTLALTVAGLLVVLPTWFVAIRHRPSREERVVVVGDDPDEIRDVLDATDVPVVGYVSPPSPYYSGDDPGVATPAVADGSGNEALPDLDCLGGLSRLDEVLVEYDVDTAVLAFARPDRAEFFGALDACYEHGVNAKVHRDHADSVLTASVGGGSEIVDIELAPWDWQDYAFKRAFDVAFAVVGLVAFAPFIAVVAAAVKLDSPGPVFYSQERTAERGETFAVYKFRSMVPEGESAVPTDDEENDRITRVGRILRRTHLDEIPQLWSILTGEMSVVGPRAVWTDEEPLLEQTADAWRKRWFVKPGLTGLAQIREANSTDPEAKLRSDLEYIRRQSFWFDVKIVVRQIWKVLVDVREVLRER